MRLYWDLVAPDGYAYTWGRSLGVVGYLDSIEIAAFLADEPDLQPGAASGPGRGLRRVLALAARDYRDDAHLLSVFAFGRGNYAYISREREWQQTAGFFGKLTAAQAKLFAALEREGVTDVPDRVPMAPVARYVAFAAGDRPAGRVGGAPGADALRAAVHERAPPRLRGLPARAARTARFRGARRAREPRARDLRRARGRADADDRRTARTRSSRTPDGLGVTARWHRLALIGGPEGRREDAGMTSTVRWRLEGARLRRTETLASERPLTLRRVRIAVPVTGTRHERDGASDLFTGPDGVLRVSAAFADGAVRPALTTSGNGADGRGARGPDPVPSRLRGRERPAGSRPGVPFRHPARSRAPGGTMTVAVETISEGRAK